MNLELAKTRKGQEEDEGARLMVLEKHQIMLSQARDNALFFQVSSSSSSSSR